MKKQSESKIEEKASAHLTKILAIDDDEHILNQVRWALSDEFQVFVAGERAAALRIFKEEAISVVLLDLGLPPHPREATEGLSILESLVSGNPLVKVIVVSGNSERHNALLAIEKGAHDIFPKPVDVDELKIVLRRVCQRIELERESLEERNLGRSVSFEQVIGSSAVMKTVLTTVRKVAGTDVPALILGESGTGKELIANAIHNLSPRKKGPFAAINCGAIPESLLESELFGHEKGTFTGAISQRRGKLESAQSGTLFLDEIGDLAPELQVKILRFLQEKVIERVGGRESIQVDSRILAATHQNLEEAVKQGRFREDLYYRLAVVKIVLPPLRDRDKDVIELAEHLLCAFSKELGMPPKRLSQPALEAMRRYDWPGNVRELQNRLKRALLFTDSPFIGPSELDLEGVVDTARPNAATLKEATEHVEREMIVKALDKNRGNISKTARALGISRPTLYGLMTKYEL
jgi:two-component system, NtrC family, response regulator